MRSFALALIWIYQNCISPLFPGCCRYRPTCSEYAKEAVIIHGVFKGSLMALWRLLRCHPFCSGGYDPVPEPCHNRKEIKAR